MSGLSFLHLLCLIILAKAPDITLPNHNAEVGKPYSLLCIISQNDVVWFKYDKRIAGCIDSQCISELDFYDISLSGNVCNLTIKNVTIHDRGIYYCENGNNRFIFKFNVTDPTFSGSHNVKSSAFDTWILIGAIIAAVAAITIISVIIIRVRKRRLEMSEPKLIRRTSLSSDCMDPSQRVNALIEYASHLEVDKTLALKHYFRSGHEMLRMANMYCEDGQLESTCVLYHRYLTLFMEKLPSHPEFSAAPQVEIEEITSNVKKVFPIAEEIKNKLRTRYIEEQHEYREQQRRLAAERAAQERTILEGQQKLDEELDRELQEDEETEIKSFQEVEYRKLQMQEGVTLKNEQRKKEALDAPSPRVAPDDGTFASGISVINTSPTVANIDIDTTQSYSPTVAKIDIDTTLSHLPECSLSEIDATLPQPVHSKYLIATNPPEEIKKTPVITDINVHPVPLQIHAVDRNRKPFYDSCMSVGEFSGQTVDQLRTVIVPSSLTLSFLSEAASNTSREIETMGILCGKFSRGLLKITNLFMPQQKGDHVTCEMENEEDLVIYQEKHNLITLGWIHTHPTQTAFLSSIDLHSHYPWQKMMPEAIAIVCAPKYNDTGIFRLTDYGLGVIGSCKRHGFHPHIQESSLFETCRHVTISEEEPLVVANKMK